MYAALKDDRPSSNLSVSNGEFSVFIDPKQPPLKRAPFGSIMKECFVHSVDLLLPEELYDLVWDDVSSKLETLKYAQVIMSLSDVLSGDFFSHYIKNGKIVMLSEGEAGRGNLYSLSGGNLRLELPKDVYERTGLVGKPISDGGRKHLKNRFAIEIDLGQPSMVPGKKGFDRILWACKNTLPDPVTWLFQDLSGSIESTECPLARHAPNILSITAQKSRSERVLTPSLDLQTYATTDQDFQEWAIGVFEWLGLALLQSPRISQDDNIDPFLSNYQVLAATDPSKALISVHFRGLIPRSWITGLLVQMNAALKENDKARQHFFSLTAHVFEHTSPEKTLSYIILCPPCDAPPEARSHNGRPFVQFLYHSR